MIRFHRFTWLYFAISAVVIGAGIVSLVGFGYRFSIDFTGGTNLLYKTEKPVSSSVVEKAITSQKVRLVQKSIDGTSVYLQTSPLSDSQEQTIRTELQKNAGKITVQRYETVGPVLGKETGIKTITASIIAICGILLYMSFAFRGYTYALAAVLAMAHDFLVVLGTYSILSYYFGAEFDLMFVTALLTTMSFSVHDTIVIFDKVREYIRQGGKKSIEELSDKAITETMVRSLNNSLTIIFMLLALLLMGGETIRFFVAALLIGTITGTYSSPFIATPLLILLEKKKR